MPSKKTPAVVTGASSGIGQAVLEKLTSKDLQCINLDIREPEEDQDYFFKTDIGNIEQVDAAVEKFTQSFKHLSTIVLCAGVGVHEKLTEGDPLKWKKVIETNLLGTLNVIRAFVPFMSDGGDIIIVSSVAGDKPYQHGGVYAATKAAVNVVAETLRLELSPDFRVSLIEPGLVESDFLKNTISGDRSNEEIPFTALPAEAVANAVAYILDQPVGTSVNRLIIRPSDQSF